MPAKKRSKPSYSVPEDLHAAPQSGWVYRSESGETAPPAPPPPVEEACIAHAAETQSQLAAPARPPEPQADVQAACHDAGTRKGSSVTTEIFDLTAKTLTSGLATIGNAIILGTRIAMAPLTLGMRWFGLRTR